MLKQNLNQKSQQKLSPNQIQLMKLVQLPALAFKERIIHEIEDNPALEDNSYDINNDDNMEDLLSNSSQDQDELQTGEDYNINIEEYLSDEEDSDYNYNKDYNYNNQINNKNFNLQKIYNYSFYEYLKKQLYTFRLTNEELIIADFIIGNIDEYGYLRYNISTLVEDIYINLNINTNTKIVENLIKNYIHKLEPYGVGARGLQECLILQLKHKINNNNPYYILAYKILKYSFKNFSKKHYLKIQEYFNINKEDLKKAISIITKLNPKPGQGYYDNNHNNIEKIIPDFTINIINGTSLELLLNNHHIPELKISNSYINMFKAYKYAKNKTINYKNTILFIKQKLDAAKYFIDALKQREQTLLLTMNTIMHYQKEYFLTGDKLKIRPMILKDIAQKINMDISTVSRVINSKYVNTPYGTILIKHLFSESMINKYGKKISNIEIKNIIHKLITFEDKKNTFTDEQLAILLRKKGYIIARRTVTKYREKLNIPVSRLRLVL